MEQTPYTLEEVRENVECACSLSNNLVSERDRIPRDNSNVLGLKLEWFWSGKGRAKGDIGKTKDSFGGRTGTEGDADGPPQSARPCQQMGPQVAPLPERAG